MKTTPVAIPQVRPSNTVHFVLQPKNDRAPHELSGRMTSISRIGDRGLAHNDLLYPQQMTLHLQRVAPVDPLSCRPMDRYNHTDPADAWTNRAPGTLFTAVPMQITRIERHMIEHSQGGRRETAGSTLKREYPKPPNQAGDSVMAVM